MRRVRPLTARYLWPSLSTQGLDYVGHHIRAMRADVVRVCKYVSLERAVTPCSSTTVNYQLRGSTEGHGKPRLAQRLPHQRSYRQ